MSYQRKYRSKLFSGAAIFFIAALFALWASLAAAVRNPVYKPDYSSMPLDSVFYDIRIAKGQSKVQSALEAEPPDTGHGTQIAEGVNQRPGSGESLNMAASTKKASSQTQPPQSAVASQTPAALPAPHTGPEGPLPAAAAPASNSAIDAELRTAPGTATAPDTSISPKWLGTRYTPVGYGPEAYTIAPNTDAGTGPGPDTDSGTAPHTAPDTSISPKWLGTRYTPVSYGPEAYTIAHESERGKTEPAIIGTSPTGALSPAASTAQKQAAAAESDTGTAPSTEAAPENPLNIAPDSGKIPALELGHGTEPAKSTSAASPRAGQESANPAPETEREGLLTEAEYRLLFRQSGLGKAAIDWLIENDPDYEGTIRDYQEIFFNGYPYTCAKIGLVTYNERLRDGKGKNIKGRQLVDLREGDVLISLSTYTLGYRHGHCGLVISRPEKGREAKTVEAVYWGEPTETQTSGKWRSCPTLLHLRISKEAAESKGYTQEELGKLAAQYAEEYCVGVDYRLFPGIWNRKSGELRSTHCSHLIWYVFQQFGYDTDSDGGFVVTPYDIAASGLFEIVQVYGINPAFD